MKAKAKAAGQALWIEWAVVFASLVSLGFPGNYSNLMGSTSGKAVEYAAFALELLAMAMSGGDWPDWQVLDLQKRYRPIYLFIAVIFLESMLVTHYPVEQAVSCIRLTVTALFAIWLQSFFSLEKMVSLLCTGQLLFVWLSVVYALLCPGEAFQSGDTFSHAFCGLFTTKNACASQLSIGAVMTVFLIRQRLRRKGALKLWIFSLAIQLGLLLLCQATGPLLSLAAVLLLWLLSKKWRLPLGQLYTAVNLAFLYAVLALEKLPGMILAALGKDATLTGRVPMWGHIIELILTNRPLTGFGYGMFWRDPQAVALFQQQLPIHSYLRTMTAGAHNMLLEMWLNTGFIGLAALFGVFLTACRRPKQIPSENYQLSLLLSGFLALNGLTERCLGSTYDCKILSLFLVLALCCNRTPARPSKAVIPLNSSAGAVLNQ